MTNILNLDELRVARSVTFGGRDRVLRSMSVEQFIAGGDFDQKLSKAKTPYARADLLVDLAHSFLEDTTRDELLKFDMTQLMTLIAFIRGSDVSSTKAEEEGAEGNAAAGSK